MYPRNLERDCYLVNWPAQVAWCTTLADPITVDGTGTVDIEVRSDGMVYQDFGTLQVRDNTGIITARLATCVGLHITGPEEGAEYTPYLINVTAWHEDIMLPMLFVAESPASVTSAAAGDVCLQYQLLHIGDVTSQAGFLRASMVVGIAERTPGRSLCFGVAMVNSTPSSSANIGGYVSMDVRRLVAFAPRVIDARKL